MIKRLSRLVVAVAVATLLITLVALALASPAEGSEPAWAGGPDGATALPPGIQRVVEMTGMLPGGVNNAWFDFQG